MRIKNRIKQIRIMQDLTQTELAAKVGCTQAYIALLESGIKSGSVPVLRSLAAALHCTVDELLKEDREEAI